MDETVKTIKTHCGRMDHGGCGLIVEVEGERVRHIKGDPEGYLNHGYLCPKGLSLAERIDHPHRLLHPLRRTGARGAGQWERISWEEALDTISHNLDRIRREHGARAVAFCQGMPKGLEHFVLIRLANLFGSPNLVAVQDLCHAPREVGGMHTCGFYPVVDFHHPSQAILLWGSNPLATNEEGSMGGLLMEQLQAGAELMVVDPYQTELAKRASHWLPVHPGTDCALALAFLQVVIQEELYDREFVRQWTHGFDELARAVADYSPEQVGPVTGLSPAAIRACARRYAQARPAALAWGNSIEQNPRNFDTVRALVSLMAICGNLDIPGGNIQANEPDILPLGKFVRADRIPDKRKQMIHAHHGAIPRLMTVPPAYFRRAVLAAEPYPVKAAYMQCCNPMLTYADSQLTQQALEKLDFLAVAENILTPTAAMADIVLPAATHLEYNDIGHYGLGHGVVVARPQAVKPAGECWPDMKILNELGKRLTAKEHWFDHWEGFLNLLLSPSGLSFEQFAQQGYLKGPDRFGKYRENGFKTPSGKVELRLSRAEQFKLPPVPRVLPQEPSPGYPLTLTNAKDLFRLNASYCWVTRHRQQHPDPVVELHPSTAAEYGIAENASVVIATPHGEIRQKARISQKVSPGVVFASFGWWSPDRPAWEGANYNRLTAADRLGKQFGTPWVKGIPCQIRPDTP